MRITSYTIAYSSAGILLILMFFGIATQAQTTFSTNVTVGDSTHVAGTLSKGSGTFVIDHPLDPKNKLLYHSFVESPDVKNIYDGIAELDENGRAEIMLPEYFLALNTDARYLATSLGVPMPGLFIEQEVALKQFWRGVIERPVFIIAGGEPGGMISWQVTGIRNDVFIRENPIVNEVDKGEEQVVDVGECLFEPLCE